MLGEMLALYVAPPTTCLMQKKQAAYTRRCANDVARSNNGEQRGISGQISALGTCAAYPTSRNTAKECT